MTEEAIRKLKEQQSKVEARSPQWMVAEQLMDLCRADPACAEIICQDLEVPELSIVEAEKKIKAFADKHKTRNFACVMPAESDRILREFYGLPQNGEGAAVREESPAPRRESGAAGALGLDLSDFWG